MRTQIVPSDKLTTRTLLASDYVFSPRIEADRLIDAWLKDNPGFMHRRTPAMKDLRAKIVEKLEAALVSNATKG